MELEPAVEADSVSPPSHTTAVALPTAPATPAGVIRLVEQAKAEIKKKVDSSDVAAMFVNETTQDMIRQVIRDNLKDVPVEAVTNTMKRNMEKELMAMLTAVAEQAEGNMKTKVTGVFAPFFDAISIK
jgi:signal transduction histidine kinase